MKGWIKPGNDRNNLMSLAKRVYRKLFPPEQTEWQIRVLRDQRRLSQVLPRMISKNSNCIDIGAHKGTFLDLILKYAPAGAHWAFEPIPELYQILASRYPKVKISSLALSDEKQKASFNKVIGALAWSGFRVQEYPHLKIEKIEVQTDLLDHVIPDQHRVDFIKIDVEGAELSVLKGARRLISEFRPKVLFEHALIHNKSYNVTPGEVFDFFHDTGMDLYKCDLGLKFQKNQFVDTYFSSYNSNYNRDAETNFIALGRGD